jgi:hypothetical protein
VCVCAAQRCLRREVSHGERVRERSVGRGGAARDEVIRDRDGMGLACSASASSNVFKSASLSVPVRSFPSRKSDTPLHSLLPTIPSA